MTVTNCFIYILFLSFLCVSCEKYKNVELPDINAKTFSYDDVVKQKEILDDKRRSIVMENKK